MSWVFGLGSLETSRPLVMKLSGPGSFHPFCVSETRTEN